MEMIMTMQTDAKTVNEITEKIIGCSFKVLNVLGSGFLEKVYENALAYELRKQGVRVEQQRPIPVYYDGTIVGDFVGDLIVEGQVIVELKAVGEHHDTFTAQCLNYLMATGSPICLLLNFGKPILEIKRYAHPNFAN
jgi:GxxExxY protein